MDLFGLLFHSFFFPTLLRPLQLTRSHGFQPLVSRWRLNINDTTFRADMWRSDEAAGNQTKRLFLSYFFCSAALPSATVICFFLSCFETLRDERGSENPLHHLGFAAPCRVKSKHNHG